MSKWVNILGIETSCDETASSVIRCDIESKTPNTQTLSNVVKSQIKLHSKFGGVVPEVAAREHSKAIRPVVEKALRDAFPLSTLLSSLFTKIDYIAVTAGPGLVASLLVGVEFAKTLSMASGVPLLAINHMEGHLYSPLGTGNPNYKSQSSNLKQNVTSKNLQLTTSKIRFPILSLIVSGGHTLLVLQKNESTYKVLGSTVDDAAGEAFDKVAKLLGLPYPGGPEISKLALQGQETIKFPRPMINSTDFNFSFSGLKTAVLYYLEKEYPSLVNETGSSSVPHLGKVRSGAVGKNKNKGNMHHFNFSHIPKQAKADIARSFENAVVETLVTKAMRAVKRYKCQTISLSGGVAANKALREKLKVESERAGIQFVVPEFRLCTDNAEMIALAGYFKLRAGKKPTTLANLQANPSWEL